MSTYFSKKNNYINIYIYSTADDCSLLLVMKKVSPVDTSRQFKPVYSCLLYELDFIIVDQNVVNYCTFSFVNLPPFLFLSVCWKLSF